MALLVCSPVIAGFELEIELGPDVSSWEPGAAPPTSTTGALELVKKALPGLLPVEVLLLNRISPPILKLCVPLDQVSVSP